MPLSVLKHHNLPIVLLLTASVITIFYLITPTLNYDDLLYPDWLPQWLDANSGWPATLRMVLLNADIGETQIRTYGLARAIQLGTVALFADNPFPTYAFIVFLHVAGSVSLFGMLQRLTLDPLLALVASASWFCSPAILPMIKVEHHYLYLVAPFSALFAWYWLATSAASPVIRITLGSILLIASWWLGEGAIIPMFGALLVALAKVPGPQRGFVAMQGAIAGATLSAYLVYQYVYINDHASTQRFSPESPSLRAFGKFFSQLKENAWATAGLPYRDAELQMRVGETIDWRLAGVLAVIIAGTGLATSRGWKPNRPEALSVQLLFALAVASLAMAFLFSTTSSGAFSVRYSVVFFSLVPIACIFLFARALRPSTSRFAIIALFAVLSGASVASLYGAEVVVHSPWRAMAERPGTQLDVYVLRHRRAPDSARLPDAFGAYPGLKEINRHAYPDPLRSMWTAEPALRRYLKSKVGSFCQLEGAHNVSVYYGDQHLGIFPEYRVRIVASEGSAVSGGSVQAHCSKQH